MPKIVPHGTLDYGEIAEWGYKPQDLVVFSSNINPYGPPPSVVQAVADKISASTLALYPDRLSLDLRDALAAHHDVPPDSILVGNGTADILWLIAVLFLQDSKTAILGPTFGEYENAATVVGTQPVTISIPGWALHQEHVFTPDESHLSESIDDLVSYSPEVVFVCNPNSPTGEHLSPQQMVSLMDAAPDALWIVDEAYAAFTPEPWCATRWLTQRNIIVLRSMTKDFALGGLRLGYAMASPENVRRMVEAQPPWNVNTLAQVAGAACMREIDWRTESLTTLRGDTFRFQQDLRALGYAVRETTANYFLIEIEDPAALRRELLRLRIVVRDCTSFGLPSFIRLATQRPEHNRVLLEAMADLDRRKLP